VESLAGLLEQRAFWCRLVPEDAPMSEQTRREREEHFGVRMGIDLASDHTMLGRSEENNWGQDRAAMRDGGSFSGLPGVSVEDVAVQEAQGPIADRSRENLGAQDIAIVIMRCLLLAQPRDLTAQLVHLMAGCRLTPLQFLDQRSHRASPRSYPKR
jgi:hypothetical protein